jgi:hypothetical protein
MRQPRRVGRPARARRPAVLDANSRPVLGRQWYPELGRQWFPHGRVDLCCLYRRAWLTSWRRCTACVGCSRLGMGCPPVRAAGRSVSKNQLVSMRSCGPGPAQIRGPASEADDLRDEAAAGGPDLGESLTSDSPVR